MASGYYQISMHPESIEYTAFVTPVRIFYMDDILVVLETKEEAYERLKLVLDVLVKAGFSFNISIPVHTSSGMMGTQLSN